MRRKQEKDNAETQSSQSQRREEGHSQATLLLTTRSRISWM